jgi:hypothetical protein
VSPFRCAREKEIAALLERGQWPQASPADLRAHAESCRTCADLILVTTSLKTSRRTSIPAALPTAGALWWRAQLRKRNQAIEKISRPLIGAQIFAFAVVFVVAIAGAAWELRRGTELLAWLEQIPRALHFSALLPGSAPVFDGSLWFLVPLLAMLALVGGIAVYFSLEKQ